MATVRSVPLFSLLTIAAVRFFLLSPLLPTVAAGKPGELATQICRNTTDFAFCRNAIYSDPRAPTANRFILAYIAFGKTYSNATDTRQYITSSIKSSGGNVSEEVRIGLQKCQVEYQAAIQKLEEMLNDLDSETYYGLDTMSVEVGNHPRTCEKGFGPGISPVSKRNCNLIKLANICFVVSRLFG